MDSSIVDSDRYQIIVKGTISPDLSTNLSGLHIKNERISILTGKIKDQSELMGVLNTLSNYNTEVISVKKIDVKID